MHASTLYCRAGPVFLAVRSFVYALDVMFDTDKCIQLIEEHPNVWDMSSKNYMDQNVHDKSWEDNGKEMFATWEGMELQEREQLGRYS
ncbi:hypothetical protein PR048_032882 [Dryococelus australis]|uniref:MADF domain-containing protein n=1 Tax=Dryococelus australis TaxID=614101 RepID=A0ABQ9G3G9_9NEOP|nr:hypothetical protein PR048_032882 [Dryococelus australis]